MLVKYSLRHNDSEEPEQAKLIEAVEY